MGQRIVVVDAFTAVPFAGNPAGVCVLEGPAGEAWMGAVARELNLSETAFVHATEDGGFALRWFTPTVEVDLCGHATLAAAHVLWEDGWLPGERAARFATRSGELRAARRGGRIELDFPAEPAVPLAGFEARATGAALETTLGASPVWIGRNRFDLLVELKSAAAVRALRPDLAALERLEARGVIVTAEEAGEPGEAGGGVMGEGEKVGRVDFVSRFFGPRVGVPEDPVTGSAHCCLGPFWAERLGRRELTGYQASARGGFVGVRMAGERVALIGEAVTVLTAQLRGSAAAGWR